MLLIWRRWHGWRRGRPFWGGLFAVLAGVEIGVLPLAPMKVMLHQGTAGLPSVVLAAVVVVLGLSGWFAPQYRGLAGIITVLLSAAALVLSNLGGFMIGTLLGVVGGALMFAWRPVSAESDGVPSRDTEDVSGGGSGERGTGTEASTAVQPAVLQAEGLGSGRGTDAASTDSGTGTGADGATRTASTASSAPASPSTPSTASPSADSSLAAAFGVDDEPFPAPRGDGPRT
ncbi:hypothetical protein K378_01025 [Streptomyces sp. Amel2xB2]|uniref:DUF6114 domain-containing protein n=1 Tax=Streptomyces sp. Amel2xB2 TaxID=1305829 RepID=UPI000DBF4691|nr:DUF6114 domain-containing protein [Streptomyces sp. Amel2xB2]RAJ69869.1 hypothetical protein K378_01025 [Streptomyces sp. Amel2xB2]